jgi:hypothetical protein
MRLSVFLTEVSIMYLDWMQWARLAYSAVNLFIAWHLTEPWAIELYSELEFPGWFQVSLFVISAGLVFPRTRRFDWEEEEDVTQTILGTFVSGLALAASFLP